MIFYPVKKYVKYSLTFCCCCCCCCCFDNNEYQQQQEDSRQCQEDRDSVEMLCEIGEEYGFMALWAAMSALGAVSVSVELFTYSNFLL